LYKAVNEDADPSMPWNHTQGASFQTIRNPRNDRLQHTSFYSDMANCIVSRDSRIVAVDVMLRNQDYAVCEINFAPMITIPSNLTEIQNAFAEVFRQPLAA
jgi:hypothetical protein